MDTVPTDDLPTDDLGEPDPLVPADQPVYSSSEPVTTAADIAVAEPVAEPVVEPVAEVPLAAPPEPEPTLESEPGVTVRPGGLRQDLPVTLDDSTGDAPLDPPGVTTTAAPVDLDGDGIITLEEVSFQNERANQDPGAVEPTTDPTTDPVDSGSDPVGVPAAADPTPVPAPPAPADPETVAELALQQAIQRRQHLESLIARETPPDAPPAPPVHVVTHVVRATPDRVESGPVAATPPPAPAPLPPAPSHLDLDATAGYFHALGIDTEHVHGSTIAELREAIEDGRTVVLAVDSDELRGLRDDDNPLDAGADRAAIVTGIDMDEGVAYVFLPPDGETMEVSLDDLRAAWDDSDNELLIAGKEAPDTDKEPIRLEQSSGDGWTDASLLLPVTLGGVAVAGGTHVLRSVRRRAGGTTTTND